MLRRTAKRWLLSTVAILLTLSASGLNAQIATPTSTFVFDIQAPDLATARGYTYRVYADGAATGTPLTNVTCTGGSSPTQQTCQAPFPAFTPGQHSVQLSAANAAGESARSAAFTFTLVAVPSTPTNIRIGSGGQ